MTGNDVEYTYGTSGDETGRLVHVVDGSGSYECLYDALGNVIREQRTIAVPGCSGVYTFQTDYTYDSWGRILDMTYPDGEVVTYDYTYGGDLVSMYGDKGLEHHDYVTDITYNDYGQRSRIDYDNGAYATYTYDALHRLSALTSVSASGSMQQIQYTMDGVGNINSVRNSATMIGTLGGRYTVDYSYDAMNRLTSAGTRTSATNDAGTFGTGMTYSSSGRLAYKALDVASSLITNSTTRYFAYCDNDKPHAPRRALDTKNDLLSDFLWDDAGNLGQVITAENNVYDRSRFLFWTEDSRLHTVADDDNYSYYAYDYAGERTLKLTGDVSVLENNAERMWVSSALKQLVMYPSPYITITDKGYTKHYYAGSERVCASIGGGMLAAATQNSDMLDKANDLLSSCIEQNSDRVLSTNDNDCLLGLVYNEEPMHVLIKGVPKKLAASINTDLSMFIAKMSYLSAHTDPENDVYFYHADHLGSASWITDKNGVPVQHLQYLPYGERFVDQHTSGYEERYTFTGKEKDSETGYYAFGARYYDCDLSGIFLSVDPMSDKYPSLSPYAYCAWNPVKLVDPNGREIDVSVLEKKNENGEYTYAYLRKAFIIFASTKIGYRELAKYAKKDQVVCGISFKENGEYHEKGIDISFSHYSLGGNSGVTRTQKKGDRISITIESSNITNIGDCLENIGHEFFIHASQAVKDFKDNGKLDHSYIPQKLKDEINKSNNSINYTLAKAEHKYFAEYDYTARKNFVAMMSESKLFHDINSIKEHINGGLGNKTKMK